METPDDAAIEESQEQKTEATIDEGELAFGEAAELDDKAKETPPGDESKKTETKTEKKPDAEKKTDKDKDTEKEPGAEKKTETDKKTDKEAEKQPPEKKTARQKLEDRVKDDTDDTDKTATKQVEEDKETKTEKAPEKETKTAAESKKTVTKPKKIKLTKENVDFYMKFIEDDAFPDGEIVVGDRKINFTELKEDEPELYDAMKVMSGYAFDKAFRHMVAQGSIVTGQQFIDLQTELGELRDEVDDSRFWGEVAKTHGDVQQLLESKDFIAWRDKQPKSIQNLAKNLETPQDAIDIIDAYKEEIGKTKSKDHDDALERKKKEKDDLHKGSMRSSQTHKSSAAPADDEGELAFKEEASKK